VVIVDSSVWIDFLNGTTNPETQWLDLQLDRERVGLTSIILTEVLRGFRGDRDAATVQAELMKFEIVEMLDTALAVEAASHYRHLRQRGHTVRKTVDLFIATLCLRDDHVLLHRDRDFDVFEQHLGLQVVHP
jgi:predicted nucleic acid-binding protein